MSTSAEEKIELYAMKFVSDQNDIEEARHRRNVAAMVGIVCGMVSGWAIKRRDLFPLRFSLPTATVILASAASAVIMEANDVNKLSESLRSDSENAVALTQAAGLPLPRWASAYATSPLNS